MFPKAGQTTGPNGLTFFEGTQEYPGGNIVKNNSKIWIFLKIENFPPFFLIHGQRLALQLVNNILKPTFTILDYKKNIR